MRMWERIKHLLRDRTRKEQRDLALKAEMWLEDDALDTAIAKLRMDIYDQWRQSRDPETRERAWLMNWTVDAFMGYLSGIVANERIEQENERRADARTAQGQPEPE